MAENAGTGAPAAPDQQPPAGTADAPAADADGGATPDDGAESISLEAARKLRSEAKALRERNAALEEAERKRADADKSESERNAERIAALERERDDERQARREMALQVATIGAARKLNFRDPDLAPRLVATADVEFDDGGTPTNVDRLLSDVAKQHPYLVNGTPDFGGGHRGQPPDKGGDMNAWLRRKAGRT